MTSPNPKSATPFGDIREHDHRSRWSLRLAVLTLVTAISFPIMRSQVGSAAEAFWMLLPPVVVIGSFVLNVIPRPRLNATSRFGKVSSVGLLLTFPIGFYGFLVRLTQTPWSWREAALVLYFFGLSLEFGLLYFYQLATFVRQRLSERIAVRWRPVLRVIEVGLLYFCIVPFLFVVLAVHRPKLLPKRMAEIPTEQTESIEFLSRDGQTKLRGVFLKPMKPKGTVLVCHGVGANHADIEVIHQTLFAIGFRVLAFDFRGHGLRDGHTITYGWNERLDVLGAYDACLCRSDVDPQRLLALGVSMGGASLLLSLPEMPQVRAAVIDSAFSDLSTMLDHQFRVVPSSGRTPLKFLARMFAWLETGADIDDISPVKVISKIRIPLLIIHGTDDRIIPVDHGRRLAASGHDVTLHLEPDTPHIGTALLNPFGYRQLIERHFHLAIQNHP